MSKVLPEKCFICQDDFINLITIIDEIKICCECLKNEKIDEKFLNNIPYNQKNLKNFLNNIRYNNYDKNT